MPPTPTRRTLPMRAFYPIIAEEKRYPTPFSVCSSADCDEHRVVLNEHPFQNRVAAVHGEIEFLLRPVHDVCHGSSLRLHARKHDIVRVFVNAALRGSVDPHCQQPLARAPLEGKMQQPSAVTEIHRKL